MKYEKRPGSKFPTVRLDAADRHRYGSLAPYTPEKISRIMRAADGGDIEQLCLAARDMMERNWDVIAALDQRADALCGAGFDIQPGDDTPLAREIADAFAREIAQCGGRDCETFDDLIRNLTDAVVMPFSAAEILWKPGGGIAGFATVEPHYFTLQDGFTPRLVTDEFPNGMDLPQDAFIIHRFRRRPDPARSGLGRVLLWLHCFQNWPIKDLFSFIERFGMPFVVATVDDKTYDSEGDVLRALIRNFGPDGGGVFSQGTTVQLLNAANTGSDNVYFHALEFCHNAIFTLLVGQLASSGDSAGMSNGDAQSAVRQDILEADARAVASTIRAQLAEPWTRFRYGAGAPVPAVHFKVERPEDLTMLSGVIGTLSAAGYKADPAELSERFGLKLRYEPPAQPVMQSPGFAFSGEKTPPEHSALSNALEEWLGPAADMIAELGEMPDVVLADRLRSGFDRLPGDSGKVEKLFAQEMEKNYADPLQR